MNRKELFPVYPALGVELDPLVPLKPGVLYDQSAAVVSKLGFRTRFSTHLPGTVVPFWVMA